MWCVCVCVVFCHGTDGVWEGVQTWQGTAGDWLTPCETIAAPILLMGTHVTGLWCMMGVHRFGGGGVGGG